MKKNQTITSANLATGADYKPFLETHHVPSCGIASRILGATTGRIHHLLSKLERQIFYLLDWSHVITDIREQFALPLSKTQEIAEELHTAHPRQIPSAEPMVMTTDFLVTFRSNQLLAINVKPSAELNRSRNLEKFEIERLYWQARNVQWRVATEKEIPNALVANLEWIHGAHNPLLPEMAKCVEDMLLYELKAGRSLAIAASGVDRELRLQPGNALALVRHFLATRHWHTDMMVKIDPSQPLKVTRERN